jgi:hypothetical protein
MLPGNGHVYFAVGRISPAAELSYPASSAFSMLRQMLECVLPRGKSAMQLLSARVFYLK